MAKNSKKAPIPEERLREKLDEVLEVLQNLFILEASKTNIPSATIREILRIDKKRIGTISKHIKPD